MNEVINFLIAILVLVLGIPLGDFLAKITKEELRSGQVWFQVVIIASLICGVISLIIRNDYLLLSFLFIAIVTSRSLKFRR